ncbi:MAG: hypothetical protein WKF35_11870 [Ferruginibacter sp.]
MFKNIYFDDSAKGFLILLLFAQLFLNNGVYLFFGAICFAVVLYNLQQPFKPSVFTLIFLYHFMQIAAGIWLSNYLGEDINFRSPHSNVAIMVSFIGTLFLFAPVIYYNNKIPTLSLERLRFYANKLSIKKTLTFYIIIFFIANALNLVALQLGGLAQVSFSLVNIKWFFFLLFGFQVVLKKIMIREFCIIIGIEFIMGFFSYFSDFKTVIFFLGFIYLTFLTRMYLRHIIFAILFLIVVFFAGTFWTSIKGEYRSFLNQGTNTQVVDVSKNDALNKLVELYNKEEESYRGSSTKDFLERLQYTYHLAKAMDKVPADIPYQYGKNWGETLEFVLTPRILNPAKPSYDASVKTTKYTGIGYAGSRSGTSVSLGYFADGYIDFGYIGMFIPLLILGLIYGFSYFYFVRHSSNNFIFNYAVVGALFMEFIAFEMDSTYLLGRLFASLLTFYLLSVFFFPWLIRRLSLTDTDTKI